VTHGAKVIELGRSSKLARQRTRDEVVQVHVRVESLEDLFAVFRVCHRGLPFWVRDMGVNDKGSDQVSPSKWLEIRRGPAWRGANG
jgi:hypothetical protein